MTRKKIIGGLVIAAAFLSLLAALLVRAGNPADGRGEGAGGRGSRGVVAVIDINGVIVGDESATGIFGGESVGARTVMDQIRQVSKNPDIKAVVLRINSPGGTPAASQEITEELNRLKAGGIKIVTSMGDVAASGAYWIASASDKIMANPGTITGSIGVIMQSHNLRGLYEKLGVGSETIKSGAYKDMGSSERPMSEEERRIFQSMVDDTYLQFVETVSKGRNVSPEAVRELNGRVLTGRQAMKAGLVDQMGNFYDAVSLAGEISGIGKNPRTLNLSPQNQWWRFLGDVGASAGAAYTPAGGLRDFSGVLLLSPPLKM
ncbi:MAG: signal peptide peptidase SppA [Bacillota bacterium]